MKTKNTIYIVLLSLGLSLSCMNKQSALNKLVNAGEDPVEAMRLPEKPEALISSEISSPVKEINAPKKILSQIKLGLTREKLLPPTL
jgi:hypothetical protein